MNIRWKQHSLLLNEPFGTAHGIRDRTEGVLLSVGREGITGYGECFMPPYYPENPDTMSEFFDRIDPNELGSLEDIEAALDYVNSVSPENRGAKAALDLALHDLIGKEEGWSVNGRYSDILSAHEKSGSPHTSYTIGLDDVEVMIRKAREASEFPALKIKLDGDRDVEIVSGIREVSDQQLLVDANQGWNDLDVAMRTAEELVELGVRLIEQPFPVGEEFKAGRLKTQLDVPVIADEDVQSIVDIKRLAPYYDGVNIKLMKAGGIRAGVRMILEARQRGLSVLLGCMTESSLGISAAAQLAPYADWCDLDGNLLIKNDTCTGVKTINGELVLSNRNGIGITDDTPISDILGAED